MNKTLYHSHTHLSCQVPCPSLYPYILSTTVLSDTLAKHFWRAGATQQVCREGMLMHHVVCAYIFQVVVILSEEAEQNTKTTLELLLRRICLLLKQARLWRNSLDQLPYVRYTNRKNNIPVIVHVVQSLGRYLSRTQRKPSVPDGVIRTVKPGNLSRQVMHRDKCKDAI